MPALIIDADRIAATLSMDDCIDIVAGAMRAVSAGTCTLPQRQAVAAPAGGARLGVMPGALSDPPRLGAKLVALSAARPGVPSHGGLMALFDGESGALLALLEAGALTALRTAAASGLATRVLARRDADVLAVLGTGEQAAAHVAAMAAVRPLREVRVWGRSAEKAAAFLGRIDLPGVASRAVADARDAVAGADIVCTTTRATAPILRGAWLTPGTHLNLVGSSFADAAEVDVEAVTRARFFVDHRAAALSQAGEFLAAKRAGAVDDGWIRAEIGEVLDGRAPGREGDADITLYKSLGTAAQDLCVAEEIRRRLCGAAGIPTLDLSSGAAAS
ncbi:MAG TPA: ornithine cyclodeaminase family protein [Azospirillaceae bacterium]|nr:ornithine cyclodeaminase family protein [Azospirillaceae bacterium]